MNKVIYRTNSDHQDFINWVKQLDQELEILDGEDHPFYDQFNQLDNIKHVVLAYNNGEPVACGAIKKYSESIVEIKRMFTVKESKGKGFESGVLTELENSVSKNWKLWPVPWGRDKFVFFKKFKQPLDQYVKTNSYQPVFFIGHFPFWNFDEGYFPFPRFF